MRLVLVAALLLAVPFLFHAGSTAHAADNEITGVTMTSTNPGELVIAWEAPDRAPTDYWVTWKKSTAKWPSYMDDNTAEGGNAFPRETSYTVFGLEEGAAYQVRVRARYFDVNGDLTESGPWSDPPVEVTVSSPLPSAANRSDKEQVPPRKSKKSPPLHDNLSYSLNELIRQNQSLGTSPGDRLPRDGGAVEESATVVVYVEAAHVQDVALFLRNNGARVRSPDVGDDYLVAEVPLSLLPRLSQRPSVEFVKVDELVQQSGGPGATAHGAAPWDTAGYVGTGVKVGVIDAGFKGYSAFIGTHLPQPEAVRCWTSRIGVQHDNLADCEAASGSNHGTAVTDMLFDVAPGATYYLARILNTSHTKDAVDWLIEKDVDVINFSLAVPWDGPGDGTSPYSNSILKSVDTAVDSGALFSATAGNEGDSSWFGKLEDTDGDNVLEFATGDECNLVTLEANESYRFDLRWKDDWHTASTDLDTRLTGPGGVGAEVASGERTQDGTTFSDPFERMSYTPTVAGDYCFVVEIQSGHTIPTWAQFQVDSNVKVDVEHTTNTHSIGNPGETKNAGALTVGAAAHDATATIAASSGRGPLPDGTIKPDIVGAHGVYSRTYGRNAYGTSFSAPHVAGLAAVIKERFPDYTPSEIATYLKDNALARGTPTPNNTWGHGFAHLPAKPPSQPVVTGRAEVGEALAVNTSAITDGDGVTTATANSGFSVQWILVNSDNVHKDIDNATASTYTITAGDRMHRIKARVSFTDDGGNVEATTSEATSVVNSEPTGILDIDGTARIGRTLTAHVVKVEDPDGVVEPFTYQWVRVEPDDTETDIATATSSTYRLTDSDAGHRIKFKLGFTDGIGNTETLESELTTTVGPNLLVGNAGQTAGTTSYVSILPATASTPTKVAQSFTTGSEDNYLITSLKAFISNGTPTVEIWDDSSGAPGKMVAQLTNPDSIPSGAIPDQLIEFSAADVSLDRETTYWVLFTLDSGQINVRTTTLTDEDDVSEEKWAIGNDFSAFIHEGTAWETGMSDQMESGPVMIQVIGVALNSNDEPVGDLLLSGAAQVGAALTVDASSVSDPNGLADATFEYQWVRIDGATETDIGSATGASYTLTGDDEGKRIKVEVAYTDDAGYDENLVSVPTQPVRPQDGIGIMVTNLYQESDGTTFADENYPHLMQAFDTGDNADGYTLNGVRVGAIAWDDGVNPVVSITGDGVFAGKSAPGRVLYTMATTTAISTDKDNPSVDVDFAAGDVYLAPNTRYWVQFFYPGRGAGSFVVGVTPEDDDDFGAAPGWTIADFHVYTISSQQSSPLRYDHGNQLRIAVLGKAGAGNRLPEGRPAISGEAQVNEVMTADTSGITDGDGLTMATYTYQWVRVDGATDTDISGSTSQTYTLTEDDQGKRIRVEVSFSDDRGHSATISSRATQPVRPESGHGIQVSNAGQDTADLVGVTDQFPLGAISFTTGGHSGVYRLNSVRVTGIANDDGATPKVSLYSDVSGLPGTVLHALTVPSGIPTGATANPAPAELTADIAVLAPNTTYWVVFERTASSANFYLRFTDSTDDDFGAASGWSLGDELAFQRKGISNWLKGGLTGSRFLFQITVKADLATVPGAPASLNIAPGDTQVTLTWTAPASDGGQAVTKYQYRVSADGGSNWNPDWTDVPDGSDAGSDLADERSLTLTSLDNGTTYTFQLRAVNSDGEGSEVEATATPQAPVAAPGVTRSVAENTAAGVDIGAPVAATGASGTVTYTLGGTDAASFDIVTSTGQLQTKAALDYETKSSYEVTVTAADSNGATVTTVTIEVTNVIELTAIAGPETVSFAENGAGRVATYTASSEEDRDGVVWTVAGTDGAHFTSDAPGGALRFHIDPVDPNIFPKLPDFESSDDADTNNDYEITLLARAGSTISAPYAVTVTVTDVDEAGAVSLSSTRPALGAALTTVLSDPDGVTDGTAVWQWERSTGRNSWAVIDGAAAASYTPVAADTNTFLRVTATYADEHGTGKTVSEVAPNVVTGPLLMGLTAETDRSQANPARGLYPAFDPQTLHYGIGCNSTDTLVLTVSAAANARVAVAGVQAGSAPEVVSVAVTADSDVAIRVTDASGAGTTYVVHCLRSVFFEIETHTFPNTDAFEDLILFNHENYFRLMDRSGVPRVRLRFAGASTFASRFHRVGADGAYRYAFRVGEDGYTILDGDFEVVADDVETVSPLTRLDRHDFQILEDGNYLLMAYEPATRDFSDIDLPYPQGANLSAVAVEDSAFQIVTPGGEAVFTWNSWGNMAIEDCVPHRFPLTLFTDPYMRSPRGDYAHMNGIHVVDGVLVASMRGCSKVLGIEVEPGATQGDVLWRMGRTNLSDAEWAARDIGPRPLDFINDPEGEFCSQHTARFLPNGNVLLFDNGVLCAIDPWTFDELGREGNDFSRAVEYALDLENHEAVFVRDHSLRGERSHLGYANGNVDVLDNGDWLVSWGRPTDGSVTIPDNEMATLVDPATGQEKLGIRLRELPSNVRFRRINATVAPAEALAPQPVPLAAEFPASSHTSIFHTGTTDSPQVVVALSRPVVDFDETSPSLSTTGATITSVAAHVVVGEPANSYLVTLMPDGDGAITFQLLTGLACAEGGICTADGTTLSTAPAPLVIAPPVTVTFGAATYTAAEGGSVSVTVELSADPQRSVTIPVTMSNEGTTTDADYSGVPNSVTFDAGDTEETITFRATQDMVDDDDERVLLGFGTLPTGVSAGSTATSTVWITDDDVPAVTVRFGSATYDVTEGGGVTVTVELSEAPERSVAIPITRSNQGGATGGDYSGVPARVAFSATETSKTFTFTATADSDDDDDESVRLGFGTLPMGVSAGTPSTSTVRITDDDDPAVTVSFGAATYTAAEGGSVSVEVTLSADPERSVTIPLTATNQGGATSADYSGVPANVTFGAAETSKTFTFSAAADSVDDDDERVVLGFGTLPTGVNAGTQRTSTVSITDTDVPAVTVSFGSATYSVGEGGSVTVTVALSEAPERPVTVPITATNQGGATGGDYSGVPLAVAFGPGEESRTFTFRATQDTVDDDDESVVLSFGAMLPTLVTAGSTSTSTVRITDNDDPPVTVSFGAATYDAVEGGSVTVRVELSAAPERSVTVPITRSNRDSATNSDYSGVPASVTFDATETSKTFTFSAVDDSVDDDGERVRLGFGTLPTDVAVGAVSTTTVSITDDDDPAVTVRFGAAAYDVTEGDDVTVTVTLSADPERSVTVPITRSNQDGATDADYSGVPASVTFTSGDRSETFTFTAEDDSVDDDDERVALSFGALPALVTAVSPSSSTVRITDVDDPEVTVRFGAAAYTAAEGGSVTVTVELSAAPERSVTVPITRSEQDGATSADYSGVPANVAFGATETSKTFTFTAVDDSVDDDDERVVLRFGVLPTGVSTGTRGTATVRIRDDDDPSVTVSFRQETYSVAEGDDVTVTVELSAAPERNVTIPLTATRQDGATSDDYSGVPANVAFSATEMSKTFTFSATDDSVDDDDERVVLRFGTLPTGVSTGARGTATVRIRDDDDPSVTVSFRQETYSVAEGDDVTVTVELSADPERSVTVPLTATNQNGATSADYSGVPDDVTFTSGDRSETFTFTAAQDMVDDDGERVLLGFGTLPTLVSAGSTATSTVSITDNDDPAVTVRFGAAAYTAAEGGSVTVTVELSADPERSVTIPLTAAGEGGATDGDYSIPADVTFTSGETSETFTFSATQDSVDDDDERVQLGFGTLPARVSPGSQTTSTVWIRDDDDPAVTVRFSQATYPVGEGSGVTVTVWLNADPERSVTIPITSAGQGGATNADYSGVPASVTFTSGEESRTFIFNAADDSIDDDGERVLLGFGRLPARVSPGSQTTSTVRITDRDDPAVTVSFGAAAYTAAEGGRVTVTVRLSADPERTVTIPLTAAGEDGATTADYSGVPGSVTFASGETSETFTFTAVDDTVDDDDESVLLGFGALPALVTARSPSSSAVGITDDDDPVVTVRFGAATYTAAEGGGVIVTVRLSAAPERSVTIPITRSEQDGTTSGDYSGVPSSVAFGASETSKTFTFSATQDTVDDDDESVALGFGTLPARVSPGSQTTSTVGITDDDDPAVTVRFGQAAYAVAEGGRVIVTVALSAAPERSVTIPLTAANQGGATSADYSGVPPSMAFGASETSKTFTFSATDDSVDDDDERVLLGFGTLPVGVSAGTPSTSTVNITDDDGSGVTVRPASLEIDEGATGTYTVVLDSAPTTDVTVTPSIARGGGFTFTPPTLTFTMDTWGSGRTVTVTGTSDADALDHTGVIAHAVASTDSNYRGTAASVSVTVMDTDDIPVTVTFEQRSYEAAEGSSVTVKALLSADPDRTVTIPVTRSNEGTTTEDDYSGVPGSVTFAAGETEASFTFVAAQDTDDDDGERVVLGFGTLPNAVTAGTPAEATLSIDDDDDPAVTASFEHAAYTAGEGGGVTVTVALSAEPEREVIIPLTTGNEGGADDDDYAGVPASVTFNARDTEQTFTFTATQDRVDDDDERVELGFGALPAGVTAGGTATATVDIADDDTRGVGVDPTQLTFGEGGSGTYTVVLDTRPTGTVTVTVNDPAGNTDVTAEPTSLTFTPDDWDSAQTVTVTAVQDSDANTDAATVTHGVSGGDYNGVSAADVTVTVTEGARASTRTPAGGGGGFGPAPVAPGFADGFRTSRGVAQNARPGDAVGDPVAATHPDDLEITYSLSGTDAASFTVDAETGQIWVEDGVQLEPGRTYTVNLTATDSAGFGAIIIVTIEVVEATHHPYDANRNGVIDRDEVIEAVKDYFDGEANKEEVIELIKLYFAR